jgi:Mg-chelatase subunit ChlD
MKYRYITFFILYIAVIFPLCGQNVNIKIERLSIRNGLIIGKIYANNEYLGPTYENEVLRIEKGTYKGVIRYYSQKNFVSSSYGQLAKEGDFLLEVANVTNRENLLFHTGNKPYHARGCVLLGAPTTSNEKVFLPPENPIRQLRKIFYGSEDPLSSPNKDIVITIDETKLKTKNDNVNTSLLILIDVSGSMAGEKLTQAKQSAKEAVTIALKNKNTEVAILAFEGKCSNPIHTANGFSTNEKYLTETINRLTPYGGTPLASAIERANSYMASNKSLVSVTQMIILLADGDDDCGNLESVLSTLSKKEIVFRHETIGLGLGNNLVAQDQLKSIAQITKGQYHNSSSSDELSAQFKNALENMKILEMMGSMNQSSKPQTKANNDKINWDILKD